MGVGEKPADYDLADYVLGHFSAEDNRLMEESIGRAVEAVAVMLQDGPDKAMNLYNG